MAQRSITSKLVDEVIRFAAYGGALTATLVAPNIVQALDKPLRTLDKKLDDRDKLRETQRVVRYMKHQGLLAGSYEHGLQLTDKARERLAHIELRDLSVQPQQIWDKRWRIIIYDIPEEHKSARNALGSNLLSYGCFQLQKSTWITPFPCREDITALCASYDVDQYVTYFEAIHLDNASVLIRRFKKKYPDTRF